MELLKTHKWLFGWSAFLIILALVVKNIPMSKSVTQLVGVIELSVTEADRTVRTQMIRKSEQVSADLPGNLAAAAGRLLQSLASEGLAQAVQAASSKKP